jgi:AcrR family transcriptional regulator
VRSEASDGSGVGGRADVRRNRRRLLDAAIELTLERGGEPTRDAVAARAGVGIATLYRHFPDRQVLLRSVALDVLDRSIAAGHEALIRKSPDPLREYLHAAIGIGLGAVNILHPFIDEPHWPDQRSAADAMLERLVRTARRSGAVPSGTTALDVTYVAIRFCRPLAIGLVPAEDAALAHRQLDTYLNGLRTIEE